MTFKTNETYNKDLLNLFERYTSNVLNQLILKILKATQATLIVLS